MTPQKTITLEEHFLTNDYLTAIRSQTTEGIPTLFEPLLTKALDLGPGRLTDMDSAGIDMQVLSLAPVGLDQLPAAEARSVLRDTNDEAAPAVKRHPGRFAAFATVPMKDPGAAVKELERCVRELGFRGLFCSGTVTLNGAARFLDAPEFFPILEAAEVLGIPVYLHPAAPPKKVFEVYYNGLPDATATMLSTAGYGWHSETALHTLRLIVAGIFDRLPQLTLIVGHMGEMLPFTLARCDEMLAPVTKHLKRRVQETMLDQVKVTTSGVFTRPPFECCREVLGIERMMYSVDHPFSRNEQGKQFLESLDLSPDDMNALKGGNAAGVLKLVAASD